MNAQLLLLLALAGPFCAFTRASPTRIPTDYDQRHDVAVSTEMGIPFHATDSPKGYTDITGPLFMAPEVPQQVTTESVTEMVHQQVTTESVTEMVPQQVTTESVTEAVPQQLTTESVTEEVHQDLTTGATTPAANFTEQTTALMEEAGTEPLFSTHASASETVSPTEEVEAVKTLATAADRTESNSGVVVEEEAAEGLTSGQVTGIALGVLLAIAFAIALVIAVARRMGKYSP